MAKKKTGRRAKPARAKKPARTKTSSPKRKAAPRKAKRKAPRKSSAVERRMKAFASEIVHEEAAPVAVRTFNEAREGVVASQELDVRSGRTQPVAPMEPLTGPAAVPKAKPAEEFQIKARAKKPKLDTRESFGQIELRMQRGTGASTIGRAQPDNLQRSFNRAAETGRVSATGAGPAAKGKRSGELKVSEEDAGSASTLDDFGDVEVVQQTRKGGRKLGTLSRDTEQE